MLVDGFFKRQSTLDFNAGIGDKYCEEDYDKFLSNENIISQLRAENFDLFVSDAPSFLRCHVLLPHILNVPFVALSVFLELPLAGVHALPSVAPMQTLALAPKMTFVERLKNVVEFIRYNSANFPPDSEWLIEKHLPGVKKTYRQLLSEAEFWLFTTMNPFLTPAIPTTPNVAFIGGLLVSPPKQLPGELQQFCDEASDGLIVMTLGSMPLNIERVTEKFFQAFSRIKQRVVVKAPPSKSSTNVKAMEWIPQNDVLGHPKTVLFITHGGANGQYEALYHGVPMLVLPLFPADQHSNGKQVEYRGFGLTLDLLSCTSDDIVNVITDITSNPAYKTRISKASKAFRSDPFPPIERAAKWVSFIREHGGSHLRPAGADMPIWEVYMLDIIGFAICVVLGVVLLLFVIFRAVYTVYARQYSVTSMGDSKKKLN